MGEFEKKLTEYQEKMDSIHERELDKQQADEELADKLHEALYDMIDRVILAKTYDKENFPVNYEEFIAEVELAIFDIWEKCTE